jgi:hypothetical protein
MKSKQTEVTSLSLLQRKSNTAIGDFDQQKEDELVTLLVKFVIHITVSDCEKSDPYQRFSRQSHIF